MIQEFYLMHHYGKFPTSEQIEAVTFIEGRYWYDKLPIASSDTERHLLLQIAKKIGNHTLPRHAYPLMTMGELDTYYLTTEKT